MSSFIPVTELECSYGKISCPVSKILVTKAEISVTGLARLNCILFYIRLVVSVNQEEWP